MISNRFLSVSVTNPVHSCRKLYESTLEKGLLVGLVSIPVSLCAMDRFCPASERPSKNIRVTRGKVELRWQPAYSRGEKALLECKTSPSTFTNRWLGITEHTGVLTLAREISARSFGRSLELDKSPGSLSGRPSRTYVERKTLASGIFSGIHVNHLYGLWIGSRNERIVVQQQSRLDYPHKLAAWHRFRHRDRNGQGIRGKVAIHDQGVARQLFVLLKDRVNARIDRLK